MSKEKKLTWYDVTLLQFMKLQEILGVEDELERVIMISELVLGDKVTDLPLQEYNEAIKKLDFLKEPIPEKNPPKKIEVNGRKYHLDCLLGNVTTAQYIDYINHSKTNDVAKMLSVFMIPEGHKYNDGYDMLQVINDINDVPIPVVNSAAFFFGRQFSKFMQIFQSCSIKKIKETNLPKEAKENIIEIVKNSVGLVLSPLS